MTHVTPQFFAAADPRDFDGDAFEVAERAVRQMAGILAVADKLIEPTKLMVRNAELERQIIRTGECDAAAWSDSTEGRRWATLQADLDGSREALEVLSRVASYNPKRGA